MPLKSWFLMVFLSKPLLVHEARFASSLADHALPDSGAFSLYGFGHLTSCSASSPFPLSLD